MPDRSPTCAAAVSAPCVRRRSALLLASSALPHAVRAVLKLCKHGSGTCMQRAIYPCECAVCGENELPQSVGARSAPVKYRPPCALGTAQQATNILSKLFAMSDAQVAEGPWKGPKAMDQAMEQAGTSDTGLLHAKQATASCPLMQSDALCRLAHSTLDSRARKPLRSLLGWL